MGWRDTLHFNNDEYLEKIRGLKDEELASAYRRRAMRFGQYVASSGVSAAVAVVTHGATIASSVYSTRQATVAVQKFEIVKAELSKRGIEFPKGEGEHNFKKGLTIGACAAAIGAAVPLGIHDLAGPAIADVATVHAVHIASHGALHTTSLAAQPLSDIGHGLVHGAGLTLSSQGHNIIQDPLLLHPGPSIYCLSPDAKIFDAAAKAGAFAMMSAESQAATAGASYVAEKSLK